jgi:hypothetical protein
MQVVSTGHVDVQVARVAVFSLHKRSTRAHLQKHALGTLGAATAEVIAEMEYNLPATYKHHRYGCLSMQTLFMPCISRISRMHGPSPAILEPTLTAPGLDGVVYGNTGILRCIGRAGGHGNSIGVPALIESFCGMLGSHDLLQC